MKDTDLVELTNALQYHLKRPENMTVGFTHMFLRKRAGRSLTGQKHPKQESQEKFR